MIIMRRRKRTCNPEGGGKILLSGEVRPENRTRDGKGGEMDNDNNEEDDDEEEEKVFSHDGEFD